MSREARVKQPKRAGLGVPEILELLDHGKLTTTYSLKLPKHVVDWLRSRGRKGAELVRKALQDYFRSVMENAGA